jgi:exonuclease VII small subunit
VTDQGCDTNPITDWGDPEAALATMREVLWLFHQLEDLPAGWYENTTAALDAIASELERADRECGQAWTEYNDSETARVAAEVRLDRAVGALRNITNTADPGHARELAQLALTEIEESA